MKHYYIRMHTTQIKQMGGIWAAELPYFLHNLSLGTNSVIPAPTRESEIIWTDSAIFKTSKL